MHSRWRRFPWKGWFPVSRNFYWRTGVKFTFANEIEAKHLRSLVSVKVEPRTWLKFTWVNLRSQKRVSGNQPEDRSYASLPTDVLWGSFVTHSFHFQYPMNSPHYYSRYQKYFLHFGSLFPFLKWMVTNEPQRTSAGRLELRRSQSHGCLQNGGSIRISSSPPRAFFFPSPQPWQKEISAEEKRRPTVEL